jgi:hypothetical protein
VAPLSGYAVDVADRIVERLRVETVASSRITTSSLLPYLRDVFQGWLQVSEHHLASLLALQRVQASWERLRATESVAPPLENNTCGTGNRSFVQLVKAYLRFDSGLDAAVDLLLADSVYKLDMPCRDDLVLCFH